MSNAEHDDQELAQPSEGSDAPPASAAEATWQARMLSVREIVTTVAFLAVPAFVFRALVVSSFNVDVATALVINTAPTQLFYASFVVILPVATFILAYVASRSLFMKASHAGRHPVIAFLLAWLGAPLAIPGALLMAEGWFISLAILVSIPVLAPLDQLESSLRRRKSDKYVAIVIASMLGLFVLVGPEMWLPPERASVTGVTKTVYVLNQADDETVIFDPKQRAVLRFPAKEITDRQYCIKVGNNDGTAQQVVFGKPKGLPPCP